MGLGRWVCCTLVPWGVWVHGSKLFAEIGEAASHVLSLEFEFCGVWTWLVWQWRLNWGWLRPWDGLQANPADVEVFLEEIELKEIAQLQRPDVASLVSDFLLQVGDDAADVVQGVAVMEEFVPGPFTVKGQPEVLCGQIAVKLVGLGNDRRVDDPGGGNGGHEAWDEG